MKRIILISTFFVIVLLPILGKTSLSVTYTTLKRSKTVEALVNSDSVSMKLVLRQTQDGYFTFESPPFLVADIDELVHIGEIKDERILSALLDPFSDADLEDGFVTGRNLKKVTDPAISPKFSGLAITMPHLDIISFNPILNRNSPLAFSVIAGTERAFAGVMHASHNTEVADNFQKDWRRMGNGKNMVFSIVGTSVEAKLQELNLKSYIFLQNAWDRLLGGGTTTKWSLKVESEKMDAELSRILGGIGPKLKSSDETLSPEDVFNAGFTLKDGEIALNMTYRSSLYEKPVYGGRSQMRLLELESSLETKNAKLQANHSTNYEKDFGKISKTNYILTVKALDSKLKAQMTLLRPSTESCRITDPSLEITFPSAKLVIRDGKTQMELSLERNLENMRLKISIDQDRMLTASFRIRK